MTEKIDYKELRKHAEQYVDSLPPIHTVIQDAQSYTEDFISWLEDLEKELHE